MAMRGSVKRFSTDQEDFIAKTYGGRRSPSSGAAIHDPGDVRAGDQLFECKVTGSYEKPARSISVRLNDLEKVADEARSEGLEPVMAMRIVCPESPLADRDGFVDVTVRLTMDDVERGQHVWTMEQ